MTATPQTVALYVPMDYPGAIISVNHCYAHANGRKYLKRGAREWRGHLADSLGWALYEAGLRDAPLATPLIIRIDAAYRNEAEATDPNNLCKLVYDAIQEATGINDRHMQPETGTVTYGVAVPQIGITVRVAPQQEG